MSLGLVALRLALIGLCLISVAPLAPADVAAPRPSTGELRLAIAGLGSDRGKVLVALFDSSRAYDGPSEPVREQRLAIHDRRAQVTFAELAAGEYALRAFHDENENGVIDTNWLGIPKESFGFSNDAMGQFGPPSFEAAKFQITSEPMEMTVQLHGF